MIDEDAVTGLTSNPSIFQKAIASGSDYDEQIEELLGRSDDLREIFFELAVSDVRAACDVLRPIWDSTGGGDGYASLEVDPGLAFDTKATIDQAVQLHEAVDRPNVFIKIPATREGLPAIEECIARSIPINVTLIFSLERYRDVVEAYRRGLERLVAGGGNPATVHSVASFFVSRVDTEADRRLDEIGTKQALELRGKLAVANARLAYEHFRDAFSDARWQYLAGKGANPQRCLWASTSTKNPAYRDVMYVEDLIGADTVNTMPAETIVAFQDHGKVRGDTVEDDLDAAHKLLKKLAKVGVDYDYVTETLELEGVQKFAESFEQLLEGVQSKRSTVNA